jgi:hypothetical protein
MAMRIQPPLRGTLPIGDGPGHRPHICASEPSLPWVRKDVATAEAALTNWNL